MTLAKKIDRLDAELLLAHSLEESREYILAHVKDEATEELAKRFEELVSKRADNTPLAYLTGSRSSLGATSW